MISTGGAPPIFIVGPVRSGSTLLRLMLNSHPQISNPGECDFLFDRVGDHGELPRAGDYIEWLSSNRIFQAKQLQVNPNLTYPELIHSFLDQLRSGNKLLTMNVHRHFHRIPYLCPDARYIHLLRDPRDVARSCIGMGWAGHVYFGVDTWIAAEDSWRRLKAHLAAGQYLDIRYEDLVNDIEAGLTAICSFLGLPYSDRMLDYASNSTYELPDRTLSYQWKSKYSVRELQLVEGKIGSRLRDVGYEPSGHDPSRPGFWEEIRLYLKHKKFIVQFSIQRYGIALYLENLIASRIGSRKWRLACQRKRNQVDLRFLR